MGKGDHSDVATSADPLKIVPAQPPQDADTVRSHCTWCRSDAVEFSWYPAVLARLLSSASPATRIAVTCRGTGDRPVLTKIATTLLAHTEAGDHILDVGAGAGGPTAWLQAYHPDRRLTAMEVSQDAIDCTRSLFPEVDSVRASILERPSGAGASAAALMLGVLSTLTEHERATAVHNARMLVRRAGLLVVTDYVAAGWSQEPVMLPGGVLAPRLVDVRRHLEQHGWRVRHLVTNVDTHDAGWITARRHFQQQVNAFVSVNAHRDPIACPHAQRREHRARSSFQDLITRAQVRRILVIAQAA